VSNCFIVFDVFVLRLGLGEWIGAGVDGMNAAGVLLRKFVML